MVEAHLPILYSFRRCPYAMRARLALLASGVVCQIREVKLSAKPEEMRVISPKATVPVLKLPTGEVIDESLAIMRWSLGQSDPAGWLQRDDAELIMQNDGPFKHHLDRTKYPERHGVDPAIHQQAALETCVRLESRLAQNGQLCGDQPGLADMAILPLIRQFAAIDSAWFTGQPLPRLQTWLADHLASRLFAAAMVRVAVWQSGDIPTLFPEPAARQP